MLRTPECVSFCIPNTFQTKLTPINTHYNIDYKNNTYLKPVEDFVIKLIFSC